MGLGHLITHLGAVTNPAVMITVNTRNTSTFVIINTTCAHNLATVRLIVALEATLTWSDIRRGTSS